MIGEFSTSFNGKEAFPMLDYLDQVKGDRTGMSKASMGLDPSALQSSTKAAVSATVSASAAQLELLCRVFAETGMKDLMRTIYELVHKYQDKERIVMLRNDWVPVRPYAWSDKYDCTVSVALGNGNKDQQLAHLSAIMQFASEAMKGGLPIANPQNMYNIGAAMVKNMGFQNVQDFLTDPSTLPPPEPPGPMVG